MLKERGERHVATNGANEIHLERGRESQEAVRLAKVQRLASMATLPY